MTQDEDALDQSLSAYLNSTAEFDAPFLTGITATPRSAHSDSVGGTRSPPGSSNVEAPVTDIFLVSRTSNEPEPAQPAQMPASTSPALAVTSPTTVGSAPAPPPIPTGTPVSDRGPELRPKRSLARLKRNRAISRSRVASNASDSSSNSARLPRSASTVFAQPNYAQDTVDVSMSPESMVPDTARSVHTSTPDSSSLPSLPRRVNPGSHATDTFPPQAPLQSIPLASRSFSSPMPAVRLNSTTSPASPRTPERRLFSQPAEAPAMPASNLSGAIAQGPRKSEQAPTMEFRSATPGSSVSSAYSDDEGPTNPLMSEPAESGTPMREPDVAHSSPQTSGTPHSNASSAPPAPRFDRAASDVRSPPTRSPLANQELGNTSRDSSIHDQSGNTPLRTPQSGSTTNNAFNSPLDDMFDAFASAITDLGFDREEPMQGLDDVSVSYRHARYPGGSEGLPSRPSTLESMLPPPVRLAPDMSTPTKPHSGPKSPHRAGANIDARPSDLARTPSTRSQQQEPKAPSSERLLVYGFNVWWPHAFDITSNLNYDSVSSTQRARLFCDAANDLLTRPTHLDHWIKQLKAEKPNQPDVLTRLVQQQQVEALDAALSPRMDTPRSVASPPAPRNELPLPSNIPYPLLAKAQSSAHADPGITLAQPARASPRKGNSATAFLMNRLERGRERFAAAGASPSAMSTRASQRSLTRSTSLAQHSEYATPPSADMGRSATTTTTRAPGPATPMGLGIMQRSMSSATAPDMAVDPAYRAALDRVRDAVPDIDDATARFYLTRNQGDDIRAINDFMTDQNADRMQRRGLFSRASRR